MAYDVGRKLRSRVGIIQKENILKKRSLNSIAKCLSLLVSNEESKKHIRKSK